MKILVVGKGGREHALVWKIAQSPLVDKIYCAPGNPGTGLLAENVNLEPMDFAALASFARENRVDLTVVGPEDPLVGGLADYFTKEGLLVFGPGARGAALEGSKSFAKELLLKHGIPTARARTFSDFTAARAYILDHPEPLVVKADGLAAGKGVVVAATREEAQNAAYGMLVNGDFGEAGRQVVIEEFLEGEEISILAFVDGQTILPMVSAQDHKRVGEGDTGPNTGGMGAYSPAPAYTPGIARSVEEEILRPTLDALKEEGIDYRGILYAGLILTSTGPQVLEFNCRFGDPETQAVLPRLKSDLVEAMLKVVQGRLNEMELEWYPEPAACVVLASGGYPGAYETGKVIKGLDTLGPEVLVFHAGTRLDAGQVFTAGGRVLGVTARGQSLADALQRVYHAVEQISFEGAYYRRDIAHRALS